MCKFEINILGCGSALPTLQHYPSSQVLNIRDNLFMIDCGEGVQMQLRRFRLKFNRIGHIFISHLHGDHCFGLVGLVSTLGLVGHSGELTVHAHSDAEKIFSPMLDYFCRDSPVKVRFEPVGNRQNEVIYEDKSIIVRSLPLKHRVPCTSFLFEEKPKDRHLIGDMVRFYEIPVRELPLIKAGADFITKEGIVIPNSRLTTAPDSSVRYAYCSDTAYQEKLIPLIEGADLLYHEATFGDDARIRAKETMHSTARQAAMIAQKSGVGQLVIGHFSARYTDEDILLQEAREVFPNTILAKEGLNIKLDGK